MAVKNLLGIISKSRCSSGSALLANDSAKPMKVLIQSSNVKKICVG
jgi:hypothetical protein